MASLQERPPLEVAPSKSEMSAFAKTCTRCNQSKPKNEFFANSRRKDGLRSECKSCRKPRTTDQRERDLVYLRGWRQANTERIVKYRQENNDRLKAQARSRHLFTTYGLTEEKYAELVEAQGGVCAICGKAPSKMNTKHGRLAVDHSHSTGEVRGLLCDLCNRGLGNFRDRSELLDAAARYLR